MQTLHIYFLANTTKITLLYYVEETLENNI